MPTGRSSDGRVGLIDVPGHESFFNMLAGVGDQHTLLVVACVMTVMAQTREHLAILLLTGNLADRRPHQSDRDEARIDDSA